MTILYQLRDAAKQLSIQDLAKQTEISSTILKKFEKQSINLSADDLDKIAKVIAGRIQLAYVAGLFDRHSSFTILKLDPSREKYGKSSNNTGPINYPSFSSRIRFSTRFELLARVLSATFSSGFVSYSKIQDRWTFFVTNKQAKKVAEKLLPYLVLKKRQAELIIEAAGHVEGNQGNRRAVIAYNIPYGTSKIYASIVEAASSLGIDASSITNICKRKKNFKTAKGGTYTFSYADGVAEDNRKFHISELNRIYEQMRADNALEHKSHPRRSQGDV